MHRTVINPFIQKYKAFLPVLILIICCFLQDLEGQTSIYSVPYNSDILLQKTDLNTGITDLLEKYDLTLSHVKGIDENSNTLYFVGKDHKFYKLNLTEGSIPEQADVPDHAKYNSGTWSFHDEDRKFYYRYNGSIYRFYSYNSVVERISLPHSVYVFNLVNGHSRLIYGTLTNNSLVVYMLNLQTLVVTHQFIIENIHNISSIIYDSTREHYYCLLEHNYIRIYDKNGVVKGDWSNSSFQNFQYDRISDRFYWQESDNIISSSPQDFNPEIFIELPHSYSKYYLPYLSKIVCVSAERRARVLNVYLNGEKTDTLLYNSIGKISNIISHEDENCLYLVENFEGQVLRYDLNTHEHTTIFSHDGIIESIAHDKIYNRIFASCPISYREGRLFEIDLADFSIQEPYDSMPYLTRLNYESKINRIYGLTPGNSGLFGDQYVFHIDLSTGFRQHSNGLVGGNCSDYLLDFENKFLYNLKYGGSNLIRWKYNMLQGGPLLQGITFHFDEIEWLDTAKVVLALDNYSQYLYSWNVETNAIDSLFKFDNQIEHFAVFRMEPNSTFDAQNNSSSECRAYPNPSHDFIYLDCKDKTLAYHIIDINGKIQTQSLNLENSSQIDISHLVPGFYFVRYLSEDKVKSLSFVKI